MKKLTILTLLLGSSTLSLFASGSGGCDSVSSSGCGAWWNNYTLGTSTDGIFAQSPGVGLSYTANYTSVSASQDPLTAAFPWIGSSSSSTLTTSNSSGYGSLMTSVSSVVATTSNSTPGSSGGYGDLMTTLSTGSTSVPTNNVASVVPTNTGGTTTMALFSNTMVSSYSSYLAQIYGLAYGSQTTTLNFNPNAFGAADPMPEPSSYISMGIGLAAVVAYARRRKK